MLLKGGQVRRRLVSWIVALCVVAGLGGLLVNRALETGPVLASVPIGSPNVYPGGPIVDAGAGRAFILDDGVLGRVVTMQGNGYSWSGGGSGMTIHAIDTRTGRLAAALSVSNGVSLMVVDQYTHRLLAIDPQLNNQVQVFDTRGERLLASRPYTGDSIIGTALVDARTGRIFVATSASVGYPTRYLTRHVLMLDGYSGKILRTYTFPRAQITLRRVGGGTITSAPPPFTMALDDTAGRLYTFDAARRMSVLDTVSGRVLFTRRLSVVLMGARIDGRAGRIVADAIPWPFIPRPLPRRGTVVVLDAHSGAILRRLPGGSPYDDLGSIGIDPGTNRVFAANWLGRSVDMLDGASGRLLRSVPLGGVPYQVVVDARRHRAAVNLGASAMSSLQRIAILDTRTGALLHTISIPQNGGPLALDPGTGHLIVTTNALLSGPTDGWSWMPGWLRDRLPGIPTPPAALGPGQRILHNMVVTLDPSR